MFTIVARYRNPRYKHKSAVRISFGEYEPMGLFKVLYHLPACVQSFEFVLFTAIGCVVLALILFHIIHAEGFARYFALERGAESKT